ncbi:MAG: hypothetical protein AAGF06_07905 [Pseudomonadota bacterium]
MLYLIKTRSQQAQQRIEHALKEKRVEIKTINKKAIFIDGELAIELD